MTEQQLEKMFLFHVPPKGDQTERYLRIRHAAIELVRVITECVPMSADQAAAVRKVREAVMTANAGIAIEEA